MLIGEARVVRHFESINEVLDLLEKDVVAGDMRKQFPLHAKYEYLWAADGTLIPSMCSSFVSPFIHRGQVARYRPCLPNVFRGLSQGADHARGWESLPLADRAKLFVERVRLEEFTLALLDHPACRYAKEIGLRLQPFGLAQHYEMATDRLDLTQDHHVAAFFATNARVGDEWMPVDGGVGVVYRIHTSSLFHSDSEHIECVGKQFLPRPEEQKAFTLTLPLGYDFERLPIEILTFQQRESYAKELNDRFAGGASLFPPDVMAEVAAAIRSESSISRHVAASLLSYDKPTQEYLADQTNNLEAFVAHHQNMRVSERDRITLTRSQQENASSAVEHMRSTFLKGIGAIAVRKAAEAPVEYRCLETDRKA